MTPAEQARAFLAMALCGGLLGAAYDLLGIVRRGPWRTALADVAFGLCTALGVIATALVLRCEAFRLYVLLGVLAGFGLYTCSWGIFVRFLTKRVGGLAQKVEKKAKKSGTLAGKSRSRQNDTHTIRF